MGFERLAKEIKRRVKVIEVFLDEGSVERLLYLLLKELNERLNSRKLRGFKEIESGNYHALPGEFLHNKEGTMRHYLTLFVLFLSLIIPFLTFGQTLNYDEQIIKIKTYISSGNFIEAEAILKELEKFYPNNSEILFLLGEVLFWQKKYEESLNYLLKSYAITKSEDIKKEIEKVEIVKLLDQAKKYQDEGNIEAAKKIYQELFFSKKNLYESGYNHGMIYLKERDYQSAVLIFEKLISLYPEDLGFKELYIEALILNRKIDEAKNIFMHNQRRLKKKFIKEEKIYFVELKIIISNFITNILIYLHPTES